MSWIETEIVYEYSPEAQRQLNIGSSIMTFTQPSLQAFLSEYLKTLPSLEAMDTRAREFFDILVMPCKINRYIPESFKTRWRGYIDGEYGSKGLAKY